MNLNFFSTKFDNTSDLEFVTMLPITNIRLMNTFKFLMLFCVASLFSGQVSAQYFGQNKPRYRSFDFKVLETPTFEIYYYTKNRALLESLANQSEQWYQLHQAVLQDTFHQRNPILFYNNHADFQQTNAISGAIGTGTGGVTEGFKNRVILPVTFTNQQTHHVLGHELVHAFQYHMMITGDSTSIRSLSNLPLWMVEGLAEYLSIGKVDPHTAMWMRDAVLHDDVPSIRDLNNPKYFPYRYGQAFWSYVAGTWGDQVIRPLFVETAKYGLEIAVQRVLGMEKDAFSEDFQNTIISHYEPYLEDKKERFAGKRIISEENAGRMNISPAMSPNGRYVIFLSEKNLFSIDLYLADARTGKILKKITSTTRDGHLDDISFLESSGTWSPNSKEYAFVAFEKGRNVLVIKEVETGKTTQVIEVDGVKAINNPAWSPDGKTLVFTGMDEGQVDLYSYDLRTGNVTQLTNDIYSEIQPNFNEEGTHLTFSTDKLSMEKGRTHGKWTMNLAVMNLETGKVGQVSVFPGANNLNPSFDHEGNVIFISDRTGIRNIYKYNSTSAEITQLTDFMVGVSGVTAYSPALSVSRTRDRIVYTSYLEGNYTLFQASAEKLLNEVVDKNAVDMTAATLPVSDKGVSQVVQENLEKLDYLPDSDPSEYVDAPYRPRFELDYAGGGTGIGVGTGTFGTRTGLAGGVDLLFSDILGNNKLYAGLALNGEIQDLGGSVTFLNTKGRVAWGASLSHIPFRTGNVSYSIDSLQVSQTQAIPVIREDINLLRIYEDQASLIAQIPFSKSLRWEANAGINYRFFRLDQYPNYYDNITGRYLAQGNRERIPLDTDVINLGGFVVKKGAFYNASTALVGDNASFGLTSPLNGYRYRLDFTKYVGSYDFHSITADGRYYHYLRPVSLAFRVQHFARYGKDANSFNPILIGWQGLVHGYDYNQIIKLASLTSDDAGNDVTFNNQLNTAFAQLSGSKFLLTSFEVRLPFTGPERLSTIKSSFLFSDLAVFFDAGVAFDEFSHFQDGEEVAVQKVLDNGTIITETALVKPKLAMSTGLSLRVNLFGALIVEPYVVYPLQKDSQFLIGFNFVPGW